MIRAATDVGGTFTDLVYLATDPETGAQEIGTAKVDTTPPDYERGVMNVIAKSGLALDEISVMAHGTTVVINALTEFSGFHDDTFNCPVEVAETRYGLYVDRLALNEGPGGEGEFRGGEGDRPRVSRALRRLLLHVCVHP